MCRKHCIILITGFVEKRSFVVSSTHHPRAEKNCLFAAIIHFRCAFVLQAEEIQAQEVSLDNVRLTSFFGKSIFVLKRSNQTSMG
jgi:hypothetical protein